MNSMKEQASSSPSVKPKVWVEQYNLRISLNLLIESKQIIQTLPEGLVSNFGCAFFWVKSLSMESWSNHLNEGSCSHFVNSNILVTCFTSWRKCVMGKLCHYSLREMWSISFGSHSFSAMNLNKHVSSRRAGVLIYLDQLHSLNAGAYWKLNK